MKIHRDIEQGSDLWHELRRGKLTASRFKDVMSKGRGNAESKTRKSYMYELAAESITDCFEHMEPNKYMIWGTETEPQSRAMYELETGNDVEEVTFITHDTLNVGVSPDGLVGDNGGFETKSPKSTTQIETYLSGKMPNIHKAQIQGCLWVSEREWWDFVSFDPRIDGAASFFLERQYRDDEYIKTLEEACKVFDDELQQMVKTLRG